MRIVLLRCVGKAMPALALAIAALAASPASALTDGVCPNDEQRAALGAASLPDCRVYELASAGAKYGQPVVVTKISRTGGRALAWSIGAFAGSDQPSLLNFYDFAREADGWQTESLTAPTGYVNARATIVLGTISDLSRGLFLYRSAAAVDSREVGFYASDLPAGPAAEIGPLFSPHALALNPAFLGPRFSEPSASGDLSRVAFMLEGPTVRGAEGVNYLWPGDTTAQNPEGQGFASLYEYNGTGSATPRLVGLDSAGHLIGQCGTSVGFPVEGVFTRLQGDELYNAVSADGSRVFFTVAGPCGVGSGPPVDELFARTGGLQTVAISEPSSGPAGDCSACDTSTPLGAVFQGASEDGTKVFFLTNQALLRTDGDGTTDLYEYDSSAPAHEKIVQVSGGGAGDPNAGRGAQVQGVARVSEDGSHVYFVARGLLTGGRGPAGDAALAGADNLYVFDTHTRETAFIADLCSGPGMSGVVPDGRCPASSGAGDLEDWRLEDSRPVDATPDGRFLVFTSSADLTPGDESGTPQVFEYDAREGTLALVSHAQNGIAGALGGWRLPGGNCTSQLHR